MYTPVKRIQASLMKDSSIECAVKRERTSMIGDKRKNLGQRFMNFRLPKCCAIPFFFLSFYVPLYETVSLCSQVFFLFFFN